jgi:plastocyanin
MKKVLLLAVSFALLSAIGVGVAVAKSAGSAPPTVRTLGSESFEKNVLIQATLRFSPDVIQVPSGGTIRFIKSDQAPDEPHTLSIVTAWPKDAEQVFNCHVCNHILESHFANGQLHLRVDADNDGGLDTKGDSLLIVPGINDHISWTVTAKPGTILKFLCAIHPWMQAEIKVTS